ncbi:E3 ubiquitin-protein ligase SIRP1 [Manihot esculenta]|uniref:RING-type E3 ubiquitin transferase n=1 Tax=Manihot esculenta TaxID=3983 RepID=A0A2C9VAQ4_MANES|nr:E3 ubiquitin-protein ligase SIRP1 [Manihot esculenta]OAY41965.1 hypothetical protein MANES_09G143100v8 [Manihot esculenta]
MEDATVDGYWCHMCSRMVTPVMESGIKCPLCDNGFVEEMGSSTRDLNNNVVDFRPERSFSLWAPILFGLVGGLSPPARAQHQNSRSSNNNNAQEENGELEREFRSMFRRMRRRRSLASNLGMLQGLHSGPENSENNRESNTNSSNDNSNSVVLVNPFNEEALVVQGSFEVNRSENPIRNMATSLGEYLMGPGLDLLLQHLSENIPNQYGTPPAEKEAVQAMPTVAVEQSFVCSICLEELNVGDEAKEMPCKHKFHSECILPWLEIHSSCPVCRFQMPCDESKIQANNSRSSEGRTENNDATTVMGNGVGGEQIGNGIGRRYWINVPWPFEGLFSLSTPQSGGSSTSPPSIETTPGNPSHTDET